MTEKSESINVTFSISKIQTLKFVIDNIDDIKDINKDSYQFAISITTSVNQEAKILAINTLIDIFIDKEKNKKISELLTRIEYLVENFDEIIKREGDKLTFPNLVMYSFIGISVSTSRGILAAKTEGSILKDVYLPVVSPSKFELIPEEIRS